MNVYTVISEFSSPQLGVRLHVADTVSKIGGRPSVVVGSTEYANQAFWDWVGSSNSSAFLSFSGTLPDPVIPGAPNVLSGTVPIGPGVDTVIITAAFGFVPSGITVSVLKPNGGDNLFATIRDSTISSTGFTVDLSAPTSGTGYSLVYVVVE